MGPTSREGSDDQQALFQAGVFSGTHGCFLLGQIFRLTILLLLLRTLGHKNEHTKCAAGMSQGGKFKLPRTEEFGNPKLEGKRSGR